MIVRNKFTIKNQQYARTTKHRIQAKLAR
jgi:hypothetical protein